MHRKSSATLAAGLFLWSASQAGAQATPVAERTTGVQAASARASGSPKPNTLPDGTPVKLRLGKTISSADATAGDSVEFEVLEDVKVNGAVVIEKGAVAQAIVTDAQHKKSLGRSGKLDVAVDSVQLADGESAPLRGTATVATSVVFFPTARLFLFTQGKDITIPEGTATTAYVQGDVDLDMSKFAPPATNSTPANQPVSSEVAIDADVPNCDVVVDGLFAGKTPSQLFLAPGAHEITVSKQGFVTWKRTLVVTGSSMHVSADLIPETAMAFLRPPGQ